MALSPKFNFSIETSTSELISNGICKLLSWIRPHWDLEKLKIDHYTNALTNTIVCVHVEPHHEKLVFRIYGSGTNEIMDRESEIECFTLLEQHGLAPAIHARFLNGFIIGYLPGRVVTVDEIRHPQIIEKLCQKLARFHQIPIDKKTEPFLSVKFQQFLDKLPETFEDKEKQQKYVDYFKKVDFNVLYEEINTHILKIENLDLVLCHNDLLINNILYDKEENEIHIIDFEYMSVNYVLFELATLFNGYAGGGDQIDFKNCPSTEEKRQFLQVYLKHYLGKEPKEDQLNQMVSNISLFQAASHLLWAVWFLIRAQALPIQSNYFEYGLKRYSEYVNIMKKVRAEF
ncbi:Choline/ethanolamine kinase [Aphelenchoides bicaudatus]|nr:Choline/ethanolamine kinase [Aphelenchoides bicaudatus]